MHVISSASASLEQGCRVRNKEFVSLFSTTLSTQGDYFSDWDPYRKTLSLAHILKRYDLYETMKTLWNQKVDFLTHSMDCGKVVDAMHTLALLVTGNMKKYYSTERAFHSQA